MPKFKKKDILMPNSKKRVFNMPKFKKEGYPSCLIQKRELSHMLNCIKKEGPPGINHMTLGDAL